jgi:hypothetical protein
MQSLLHLAAGADALLAAITTAWAALGELLTAGALLWLLNQLANLTRLAYRAGFALGTIAWPLIHFLVRGLRQIDWRFAALVALDAAKVLLAFTITAARAAQPALVNTSACIGRAYSCLLVGAQAARPAVVEAVAPALAVALPTTVVALRKLARERGIKTVAGRRVAQARKAELLLALGC